MNTRKSAQFLKITTLAIVGGVSLSTLAGCSTTSTTSSSSTQKAASAAPSQKGQAEYSELSTVVAKTKTATAAGNFKEAQTEFAQFENSWKKVEDGVKAKSSAQYDKIESNMDEINNDLKATQPNKLEALKALTSLDQTIASIPKDR